MSTVGRRASRISVSLTGMLLGSPWVMCRPRTSILIGSSSGAADPIAILMNSAVRSPISRPCAFFM